MQWTRSLGARRPQRQQQPDDAVASSEQATVDGLCDEHGGALFALALTLVRDSARATQAVTDVLSSATGRAFALTAAPDDLRRELARRTYQRCCGGRIVAQAAPNERQKLAMTLVLQGRLNYRDTAELLGLSSLDVVGLLGAELRELSRI